MPLDQDSTELQDQVAETTLSDQTTTGEAGATGEAAAGAATDDKGPKSPLEAVRQGFEKLKATEKPVAAEPGADSSTAQLGKDGTEAKPATQDDLISTKIPDEEWKAIPAVTRQRIQQYRKRVSELNVSVQGMTPKAATYDNLSSWMAKSNVSQEGFIGALELEALLKSDPLAALNRLRPVVVQLAQLAGEILPDDLQDEVDKGTINVDHAKELVRHRNEAARLNGQVTQRTQADRDREVATQAQGMKAALTGAIATWEAKQKTSDPDYPMKSERIWERMQSVAATQGWPNTPDGMIKLAEKAKVDVDAWLGKVNPGRKNIVPIHGSGAVANANAVPKTPLEAVQLGISMANA